MPQIISAMTSPTMPLAAKTMPISQPMSTSSRPIKITRMIDLVRLALICSHITLYHQNSGPLTGKDPELFFKTLHLILETDFRRLSFYIGLSCLQEFLLFLEVEHAGDDCGRELLYFIVVLQHFVIVGLAGETDFIFG
jgi:hypothetical protein